MGQKFVRGTDGSIRVLDYLRLEQMSCRHCGMSEGEPYNGSANCMWYGENAYSDERKRDLARQGCFTFKKYAEYKDLRESVFRRFAKTLASLGS